MLALPKIEFENRIIEIRRKMVKENVEVFIIYGDEYRRENLRYVSNYWPIFERGMLIVGLDSDPILLVSPECLHIAGEMSVWSDIRVVREVGMSYVPEEVDFTNVEFTSLDDVINELTKGKKKIKIKISGMDAMSVSLYKRINSILGKKAKIENGDSIIYKLRYFKTPAEIEMLKKAWEICDIGYKAVLDADIIGLTELQAAAIGEKAARDAGAEHIVFSIFTSGERTNTVVGRPTEKIVEKNNMIMYALAVQYEGYIATDEWPFIAGGEPTAEQKRLMDALIIAENIGLTHLKPDVVSGEVVKTIRTYFKENGFQKNDLYPPIHGNGLAEAESPYPDENSQYKLVAGMGVNLDISLFGVEGVGSNRIEEGFIISDDGVIELSSLISKLRRKYLLNM